MNEQVNNALGGHGMPEAYAKAQDEVRDGWQKSDEQIEHLYTKLNHNEDTLDMVKKHPASLSPTGDAQIAAMNQHGTPLDAVDGGGLYTRDELVALMVPTVCCAMVTKGVPSEVCRAAINALLATGQLKVRE